MKKRVYLLLTLIISIFIGVKSVGAFSMFLECEYTKDCTDNIGQGFWDNNAWSRWCLNNDNYYVPITNNDGNLEYYIIGNSGLYMSLDTGYKDYGCWLTDFTNENCKDSNTFSYGPYKIFSEGICPSGVVNEKGAHDWINSIPLIGDFTQTFLRIEGIPVGKNGKIVDRSDIDETEYVIYSFTNKDGNTQMIAEGFTYEGKYCFAGGNVKTSFWEVMNSDTNGDEFVKYLLWQAYDLKTEFWKVHNNYRSRMIFSNTKEVNLSGMNVCAGMSELQCAKDVKDGGHNYKVIIDSDDSNENIKNAVEEWYEERSSELDKLSGVTSIVNNEKFINTCNAFNDSIKNGRNYTFSDEYTKDMFINDLKNSYNALNTAFDMEGVIIDYSTGKDTSPSSSIVSYIYVNMLGIDEIVEIAEKNDKEYYKNIYYIVEAIKRDVSEALSNYVKNYDGALDILNLTDNLVQYTELFYTAVMYLDSNQVILDLNATQSADVADLKNKFKNLVDDKNLEIYPIINCETLLGQDLIDKINDYLDIFKIAIPILLIGFGIVDFTKAIFADDQDKMKKAQSTFFKRLIIAVLIFLVPLLVNLLLNIANHVWSFISPNTCGLF